MGWGGKPSKPTLCNVFPPQGSTTSPNSTTSREPNVPRKEAQGMFLIDTTRNTISLQETPCSTKSCLSECLRTLGPSTHRDRDYSVGEDELQQQQFCFFCCRVWSSVKIPIREAGEGLLLNWKLSWWPYFRNVQMLDIHLVIYTLVVNCSETSGSVDKQRGWLWSFLPSVFTSRSQSSWIIRIQY